MGAKPTRTRPSSQEELTSHHRTAPSCLTAMLLLAHAPPPPVAANSSVRLERALRPGRLASSRAVVATAAARSASSRGEQKRKQVASVANPLVKHCVKLRLSAAYRRSCRRLLLVGLAPILYPPRFHPPCHLNSTRPARCEASLPNPVLLPPCFREMCRFELDAIDQLLLLDGVEVPEVLREFSGDIVFVSDAVMKKVSGMQSVDSTEAIAVMHMPRHFRDLGSNEDGDAIDGLFNHPKRILVLDGIQVRICCTPVPQFCHSLCSRIQNISPQFKHTT